MGSCCSKKKKDNVVFTDPNSIYRFPPPLECQKFQRAFDLGIEQAYDQTQERISSIVSVFMIISGQEKN